MPNTRKKSGVRWKKGCILLLGCGLLCNCSPAEKAVSTQDIQKEEEKSPAPTTATQGMPPVPEKYTAENFKDNINVLDALALIEQVEAIHPWFLIEEDHSEYLEVRNAFLEETEVCEDDDFQYAAARYLCFFHDAHTGWFPSVYTGIDVDIQDEDGKLRLTDGSGLYLEAINDVSVSALVDLVNALIPAENEYTVHKNRELFTLSTPILKAAGMNVEEPFLLRFSDGSTMELSLKLMPAETYPSVFEIKDGIALIPYKMCDERSAETVISEIEQAKAEGITRFIFDVRGNPGGNTGYNIQIFEALGVDAAIWSGVVSRCSAYTAHGCQGEIHDDLLVYEQLNLGTKNTELQIAVLTDWYTFSSGMAFAMDLQDSSNAILVGEPSRNAPESYGDIVKLSVPHHFYNVGCSWKKFFRDDPSKDHTTLMPDILCDPKEAPEKAREALLEMDM